MSLIVNSLPAAYAKAERATAIMLAVYATGATSAAEATTRAVRTP